MPFYDNTDSTKYIESDNIKVYQSAILKNSGVAYWILLFNEATDVINQYASGSRPTTHYTKQGNNCYSRYNQYQPTQVFQKTTLSGIEIYFNDSQYSDTLEPWDSNIPVFYNDAQAFRDYITNLAQSYNWQSVPSISGKNGILSLPVLVSTDGEPVSSGSASDFSALPSVAIVRTLANEAISGG